MEKRFLVLVSVVLASLIMLSACGDQPVENDDSADGGFRIITATPQATGTSTITPTPLVPELEETELAGTAIEIWYFWDNTLPDALADLTEDFNDNNQFGIIVSSRAYTHPLDLADAVEEAIATGQSPDVVLAEPYQYLPWVDAEVVVDLAPYIAHPIYGLDSTRFYPVMLGRDQYSNGQWAFPGLFSAQVILYNQTWAEELGYDTPPATPTMFRDQACAAHIANGNQTGGWMIDSSPGGAAAWLLAFSPNFQQTLDVRSSGVETAYTFLSDLFQQDCAWQPAESYPDADFISRQGLFYTVNTSEIGFVTEAFSAAESNDTWTAVGYPNPNGDPVVLLTGRSYVVLESEIDTQIASWLLIRDLVSEQSQVGLAQSGLFLPLDQETAERLRNIDALPPVWQQALSLVESVVVEPHYSNWGIVRSVLQDAQAEVLNERFVPGTLSLFLDQLGKLIQDLQ